MGGGVKKSPKRKKKYMRAAQTLAALVEGEDLYMYLFVSEVASSTMLIREEEK